MENAASADRVLSHQDQERSAASNDTASTDASDWLRAHEELSKLARTRAELDWHEGRWLLRALRSGTHVHLGFGSFAEYVERLFGYKPRSTEEKLRVADALEHLPELHAALQDGSLCWSAVRELTRVATPANESQWLGVARGKTQRQIEQLVAGRKPGDGPDAPAGPVRHVLRFEVSAETLATFRDAMAQLRRAAAESLDDDAALLLLARHVLAGTSDEGRSNYQVAITVCERCERGFQESQAQRCDAQHMSAIDSAVDSAHVGGGVGNGKRRKRATQSIPPATRRLVLRRDGGACVVPGCTHSQFVDVHHLQLRSEGGAHDPEQLIVLCAAHHRALHQGKLRISGAVSEELTFTHADGSCYGRVARASRASAYTKAFQALRSLGFKEGETRHALEQVQQRGAAVSEGIEAVIRAALALLTERKAALS